jgi:drug/metabolite transporter (DMT)-like permease
MFKLAKRYHIDVLQAITWNYSTAIFFTWLIFKPKLHFGQTAHAPTYLAIGILLPVIFLVIAAAIKVTGIVRTDVAQRLSLIIPIISAFLLLNEPSNLSKIIGILIGFGAIICLIPWPQSKGARAEKSSWIYLVVVFIGLGIIDILFKQVASFKDVTYSTSLFSIYVIAFVVSVIILIVQIVRKKTKFSFPHILIGWVLGLANFGNIVFYIKAHQSLAHQPSTVFALADIGVIVLGTIIGLAVFKEKLSTLNKIGVALALIAIAFIFVTHSLIS